MHVGKDLGHLFVAVVLAQVLDRLRIELVGILGVVLKQTGPPRLGRKYLPAVTRSAGIEARANQYPGGGGTGMYTTPALP